MTTLQTDTSRTQDRGLIPCDLIVVTHNSARELREFWLGKTLPSFVKLHIVDNGSTDDSVSIAQRITESVTIQENRGLSHANNVGFDQGSAPYVIYCNPDVHLDAQAISQLVLACKQRGGLIAPRLVSPNGALQANGRSWPTMVRQLAHRFRPGSRAAHAYLWPERPDWVTGALIVASRSDMNALDGWPESYFLYCEDVALCLKATVRGLPVSLLEEISVIHGWQRASHKLRSPSNKLHMKSLFRLYLENPRLLIGRRPTGPRSA